MKRSMFTIGYRNSDKRLAQIIPELAEVGYDGVEIWWPHVEGLCPEELAEVKALAGEHGLAIPMLSGYLGNYNLQMTNAGEMLDRMKAIAPAADALGVKLLRSFVGWTCECSSNTASEEYWAYNIAGYRQMVEIAEEHDLYIAMETHSQTLADSVQGVQRMIEACGPRLKVNLQIDDIVELSGLPDAVAVYEALKDHVVHFHLQPCGDDPARMQKYRGVFAAMQRDGFDGFISWEIHGTEGDPRPEAETGLKVMDELGVR